MVPGAGLEPAWLTPKDFKSFVSTDFTTRAGGRGAWGRQVERRGRIDQVTVRGAGEEEMEAEPGIEPRYTALQAAA